MSRKYNREMIRHMYIEEGMTVRQIADEIGATYVQLKSYMGKYGIVKSEFMTHEEFVGTKKLEPKTESKPYDVLDETHVLYNGKVYKKMSKEEVMKSFMEEQRKRDGK